MDDLNIGGMLGLETYQYSATERDCSPQGETLRLTRIYFDHPRFVPRIVSVVAQTGIVELGMCVLSHAITGMNVAEYVNPWLGALDRRQQLVTANMV